MLAFYVLKHQRKRAKRNIQIWILVLGTWLVSATPDLLFHTCLLVLSHSGRHESTTVCTLLLCAGPIEGSSAVLAVRRYYGFRSLWFVLLGVQKKKSRFKNKTFVVCVPWRPYCCRADDTASFVSKKRISPQQSCSLRGWYSPVQWLRLRRAPVSRTCHT